MLKFRSPTNVVTAVALIAGLGLGVGGARLFDKNNANHAAGLASLNKKKIIYYRNPMGLADTSPKPMKDAMGMDYIPVYEGEDVNGLIIDSSKAQKSGVRVETVSLRRIEKSVQLQGRIEADERRQYVIAPKFDGWVEKVHVATTGQYVKRGTPLFEVFSPDLISAQKEYLVASNYASKKGDDLELGLFSLLPQSDIALQGAIKSYETGKSEFSGVIEAQWQIRKALEEYAKRIRLPKGSQSIADNALEAQANMRRIADAALMRLHNFDVPESRIKALQQHQEPFRLMNYLSPVSGVVTEKKALQGIRFRAGDVLYQVTDTSSVWVLADVFESDISNIRIGQDVNVSINAYPAKILKGKINYVYPTLNPQTRSVQVRIEMPNADGLLKPGMFAKVELKTSSGSSGAKVLAIPSSAVLDSGQQQHVFVRDAEGRFVAREVRLGMRGNDFVEVLGGVQEGEAIVVSGNFLIDSESNLKSALKGYGAAAKKVVSHHAEGVLDSRDAQAGSVVVTHDPVASLNWPKMTMEFIPAHSGMFANIKPGTPMSFEFVERNPGEWVITKIDLKGKSNADRTH